MNKRIFGLIILSCATLFEGGYAQTPQTVNKSKKEVIMTMEKKGNDEAQIRKQMDNFIKAFRTKDLNLMMFLYATGFVAFDIVPPLQEV